MEEIHVYCKCIISRVQPLLQVVAFKTTFKLVLHVIQIYILFCFN